MNTSLKWQTKILRPEVVFSLILILSFLWFYMPVITDLAKEWIRNPDNSHGFLVPFISGYLLWISRERIRSVTLNPSNGGLFLISGGIGMYILGYLGAAHTTIRVSMFIFVAGCLIFLYGIHLFKAVSFPFFYSLFMIPVPYYLYERIAFPLKLFVTRTSVWVIDSMGIPVLREGNIIQLPNITLQVVDACSGIRSLTSLLAITVVYAYLTQRSKARMVLLILLSVPLSVFANILRVLITGILSRYYGTKVAEGFFHESAGLGVFLLSCILVFAVGWFLKKTGTK